MSRESFPNGPPANPAENGETKKWTIEGAIATVSPARHSEMAREIEMGLVTLSDRLNGLLAHQKIDPINPDVKESIAQTKKRIARLMEVQADVQSAMGAYAVPIDLKIDEIQELLRGIDEN